MNVEIKLLELMAKKKIRRLRELSRQSNVTEQTISNLLNRKSKSIRLDTLAKLCKTLDCAIGEIIVIKK